MHLTLCSSCSRHVRIDAGVCPFCDAALPRSRAGARVGALLLGAAAISTLGGCPRPAAEYGGPPPVPPPEQQGEPSEPDEVEAELHADSAVD
jgi:hypothetical protein